MLLASVFFLIAILLAIGALLLLSHDAHVNFRWEKKWPPIDDDEFLRRCGKGTNRDTALRVRRIVSEQLGIPYNQVYPEQNFVNDLFCD